MKRNWLFGILCVAVLLGLPAFLAWNMILAPTMETTDAFRGLIGKSEAQVIKQLGQPKFREVPEEARKRGVDFAWREKHFVPIPARLIHGPVLLYETHSVGTSVPLAVYIFEDTQGRVEAIDFAGA